MSETKPLPSVLEIIERGAVPDSESFAIPIPNEVRINGISLWTAEDHPITVHEIEVGGNDLVLATITLICRRVVIGFEADI